MHLIKLIVNYLVDDQNQTLLDLNFADVYHLMSCDIR